MRIAILLLVTLLTASPALAAGEDNPFAGTIYQAIAAAITFIVVFLILKTKAWGPILKGLQDRENKIRTDLQEAERAASEAKASMQQYKQQLATAEDQARQIIEKARADADRMAHQLKSQTEKELLAQRERAKSEIASAKQQALAEIYAQVAVLSTDIAGRILQREIRPEDQKQLVDDALREMAKVRNN